MENIVSTLFQEQNDAVIPFIPPPRIEEFIPISDEELLNAANKMKNNKAPGPDGIPNVAVKAAIKTEQEFYVNLYSQCLLEGNFSKGCKKQKLVLLLKPGKQPDNPFSYRPLCMLDLSGKILERIIADSLLHNLESPIGLSDKQSGFRRGSSRCAP